MKDDSFDHWEIPDELRRKMIAMAHYFRIHPTKNKAMLWGKKLSGIMFRRQQPIEPFIVDFCAFACRLIVEVDGSVYAG